MHIKLFYVSGANCCERVRWALDYKCVSYDLVDLEKPFDEAHFYRISPFGRVPVMVLDGAPLTESMAMLELIEEVAPSLPLNYVDPVARAKVREICEAVNSSIHPIQNSSIVKRFRPTWTKQDMKPFRANWIAENLEKLEPLLWLKSQFAVGTQFTFADILVAVIYRKCIALGHDSNALSRFSEHWAALMSVPAICASCPLPEARNFDF